MVPIPFVISLLLLVLLGVHHSRLQQTHTGRLFEVALGLHALGSLLVGLRWWLDWPGILPFAAAAAVAMCVATYLAFRSLGGREQEFSLSSDWMHLLLPLLVLAARLVEPWLIDFVLAGSKLVYVFLLFKLIRRAPESLALVRLDWIPQATMAVWGTLFLLLLSVVIDLVIAVDFALNAGRFAPHVVSVVNSLMLVVLAFLMVIIGRSRSLDSEPASLETGFDASSNEPDQATVEDDQAENESIFGQLELLMLESQLFKDPELNLQRLARKMGVPARKVSRAVNACTDGNISQWINQARIDAACELLSHSDMTIQQAMLESGFTTKSNFNREFRRIHNSSPTQWRVQNTNTG